MDEYRRRVTVLASFLAAAVTRSLPDATVHAIANPVAGARRKNEAALDLVEPALQSGPAAPLVPVAWTDYTGHARKLAEDAVRRGERNGRPLVLVSIGGDGTHNEICSSAIAGTPEWEGVHFLRVPLGSGNDGAEARGLDELVQTARGVMAPQRVPAVVVRTREATFTALNIASFGLDAFVTVTRERARRVLRGNGYKIVADAAVLFYERIVNLQTTTVRLPGGETWNSEVMLIAFGASGERSYGGHIHVLPDERNVCVIARSGIRDKLRLKKLFYGGSHTEESLVTMRSADELTIEYGGDLHYQVDGEGGIIPAGAFPVVVQRVDNAISVLRPARLAGQEKA